jgi:acetate kinase
MLGAMATPFRRAAVLSGPRHAAHPGANLRRTRLLGIELNQRRNAKNAPLISPDVGRFKVRVIRTDEDLVIARSTARVINLGSIRKT